LVGLANRTVTGAPKGPSVTKSAFFSFHYDRDHWRVQQVLNIGSLEGQTILNHQKWEEVKRQGDDAVKRWIEQQMNGKSVVVVLVGAQTSGREWVQYEIAQAWNNRKPLVGIRIHGLQNEFQRTDQAGPDPFAQVGLQGGGTVADYVKLHSPTGFTSQAVYADIKKNLLTWVDSAYRRS